MADFFEVITMDDIAFALVSAMLLTFLINRLMFSVRVVYGPKNVRINYDPKVLKSIVENCYDLFPREIINFRGATFKRGMRVKIMMRDEHVFTGEIIGLNKDNMLCLLTQNHIVAHELSQIAVMTQIQDGVKMRRD